MRSENAAASGGFGYYRNGRRFEESARTDKYEKARDALTALEDIPAWKEAK